MHARRWIRAACLLGLMVATCGAAAAGLRDEVRRYRLAHEAAIVGQLVELTRLQSVAAQPEGLAAAADRGFLRPL